MCYRGSQTGAGGREFAGFESVEGGVRGIFIVFLYAASAILAV
jgi:hypothetical protein